MISDHEQTAKQKKSKRKHRQEEQDVAAADNMNLDETAESSKKDKKKKSKDKKRKERTEDIEDNVVSTELNESPEKKTKRRKNEDKIDKKQKRASSPATTDSAAVIPDDKQYPFFTQTFSQRIPVWPAAFDEPLTKTAREYLDPQLNRYSPKFKGVLLAYKNVNLSDRPQRANPKNPPTDDTPVTLASFECYAPPFAWLTADLHLFVPSRGAWMEGEINLQSESHVGVVCFEKFNASISRRSLPKSWSWVEQEEMEVEEDPFQETAAAGEEDGAQEGGEGKDDAESAPRLRSTGYWVDETGKKVEGKIYFRIKNFSSGSTGDYTYLSLQGTMLDDEAEKESAAEERAIEKARRAKQNSSGLLYPTMRIPESSMTKLKDITL
ncbi:hypothetical protein N0V93_001827 [Gnomoniopsis smithogilvyi]|uniref:DNA-directed RNA polymerase subunit n=1 Tax=Gnomoniopsis smithogilvyi TaxID=1191159 RepID=A0A9W9D2K1_9PEZI|nr:hypothetical protein N0V93_001827 [Gnomoniopsis smithogilvyi]